MNEIPTPETDAMASMRRATSEWVALARDLERRLTVAREALQAVSDAGGNYCDLLTSQEIAKKALPLTAPKQ